MGYGGEGKLVRLAVLEEDRHLENVMRWINDPSVTDTLAVGAFPMMRKVEKEFFDRMAGSKTDMVFAIETLDGRHVGMSGIHQIDWVARHAVTGSFIGEPSDRGLGYGSEAAILRARHAFHALNLSHLYSSHLAGNDASARMQAKLGAKEWGIKPRCMFKKGQWVDLHELILTREDWERLHGQAS